MLACRSHEKQNGVQFGRVGVLKISKTVCEDEVLTLGPNGNDPCGGAPKGGRCGPERVGVEAVGKTLGGAWVAGLAALC